jgi:hypothetical protein
MMPIFILVQESFPPDPQPTSQLQKNQAPTVSNISEPLILNSMSSVGQTPMSMESVSNSMPMPMQMQQGYQQQQFVEFPHVTRPTPAPLGDFPSQYNYGKLYKNINIP